MIYDRSGWYVAIAKSVWSSRKFVKIKQCSFNEGIKACIRGGGRVEMM